MNLRLILVRHCQSYGNVDMAEKPSFRPDDPPLTPEGKRQAELLAARYSEGEIDKIYSSTLIRTVETVYPLAEKLGLPVITVPQLMEMNTGITGTDTAVLEKEFPLAVPDYSGWLMGEETTEITEGRADFCVKKIFGEGSDKETVLVATHGSFYGFILRRCLGLTLPESFNWQIDNCSVTEILFRDGKIPKLVCANDTKHLVGGI